MICHTVRYNEQAGKLSGQKQYAFSIKPKVDCIITNNVDYFSELWLVKLE